LESEGVLAADLQARHPDLDAGDRSDGRDVEQLRRSIRLRLHRGLPSTGRLLLLHDLHVVALDQDQAPLGELALELELAGLPRAELHAARPGGASSGAGPGEGDLRGRVLRPDRARVEAELFPLGGGLRVELRLALLPVTADHGRCEHHEHDESIHGFLPSAVESRGEARRASTRSARASRAASPHSTARRTRSAGRARGKSTVARAASETRPPATPAPSRVRLLSAAAKVTPKRATRARTPRKPPSSSRSSQSSCTWSWSPAKRAS